MKALTSLLLFYFFCSLAIAQNPLVKQWDYRFGGTGIDWFRSFEQTTDGGYILGGDSESDSSGDKTQNTWPIGHDYWVIKIDASGNKQWDKRFGGTKNDDFVMLQQTKDGGYVLGGDSRSQMSGDKSQDNWSPLSHGDFWIVKVDAAGTKQWDKRYGGIQDEDFVALDHTADGGYILGGTTVSHIGGDKTEDVWDTVIISPSRDYWIIKIDSNGTKEWDKDFGGIGSEYLTCLKQTSDGGYILGGQSNSPVSGNKTQPTHGSNFSDADFWIVKIDALGNKQWDKDFGGIEHETPSSIALTADGGYIICGNSYSGISGDKTMPLKGGVNDADCWIVKIDSLGVKQWDRDFGGNDIDGASKIFQAPDGGFLISAASYSNMSGDKSEDNLGLDQTWIIKTDSTGNKLWDKTIFTIGDYNDIGYCIQNLTCYTIAMPSTGGIGGYKTQNNWYGLNNPPDYWIVKFCDTSILCNSFVSISINGNILTAYNGFSYQWYLNGVSINGATSSTYIATQSGSYTVQVTYTNGCIATSQPIIISGIDNLTEEDIVSVYQLTVGSWQLTVGNNFVGGVAEVFDANGRIVFQSEIRNQKSEIALKAARGVYLLRISSSKSSVVRKLVRL